MTTGCYGTPLGKRLSLKPSLRVWFDSMPDSVLAEMLFAKSSCRRVDVKVCAVDAVWSGLKLMIRKERR